MKKKCFFRKIVAAGLLVVFLLFGTSSVGFASEPTAKEKYEDLTKEAEEANKAYEDAKNEYSEIENTLNESAEYHNQSLDDYLNEPGNEFLKEGYEDAKEKMEGADEAAGKAQEASENAKPKEDTNVGETVLPGTKRGVMDCEQLMLQVAINTKHAREALSEKTIIPSLGESEYKVENVTNADILGCAIKTGQIKLWMMPYYVRYLLEFALSIAGLVAVGGIVYGGFLLLFAGVSDEKEKGKNSIIYGVAGMVITLIAWAAVNIVIAILTG